MKRVVILLLTCLLFPVSSFAQFWLQTAGPGAGSVRGFGKGKAGVILAASDERVFFSKDNGASWKQSDKSFTFVTSDVFGTDSKGTIYAATTDGIFYSNDDGNSWVETDAPAADFSSPKCIAVDKENDIIYVGTDNAGADKGICRSDDGGQTWTRVITGLPATPVPMYADINTIAVSTAAATKGTIFVGCAYGLSRSTDEGATWEVVGKFNDPLNYVPIQHIAISPSSGRVFAITSTGLFASSNNGDTWTNISNKGGLNTTSGQTIATDEDKGVILCTGHDGVYISLDNGVNWIHYRANADDQAVLMTGSPTVAFVGTSASGVSYSLDKGKTWIPRNKGLFTSNINAMCADNKGNVFANVYLSSTYSTSTAGDVWTSVGEGLSSKDIRGLTATPANTLFAATYQTTDDEGGLLKSVDGGINWTNISDGGALTGIYKTKMTSLLTSPGGIVFAGGDNGVVYISADDGANWLNSGKPIRSGITQNPITALAWVKPDHVFAANADGVFRSNAISDTTRWEPLSTSPKNATAMVTDLASDPSIIYVSAADGIYKSNDDGNTWTKNTSVTNAVGVAINSKGVVYAIGSNGTFSSNDKGATWKHESDELNSLSPTLLFVDHKDVLYAGTAANGVYRNPLFPTDGVFARSTHSAASISFENNYPNPFAASTNIRYSLVKPAAIKLEVFDITGKYIATLVDQFQTEGSHSVAFEASSFSIPGGVYNCRLSSNGESVMTSVVYMGK